MVQFKENPVSFKPITVNLNAESLLSILEFYLRRPEDQTKVVGALMGRPVEKLVDGKRAVLVTKCFPVPLNISSDNINLDVEHFRTMRDLHYRISKSERIVGWYVTGTELDKTCAIIHSFFAREVASSRIKDPSGFGPSEAVCLLVDPSLEQDFIPIKAFIDGPVGIDEVFGSVFQPVGVNLDFEREMMSGLSSSASNAQKASDSDINKAPLLSEIQTLQSSLYKSRVNLDDIIDYVDDVASGQRPGDKNIGRMIMEILNNVSSVSFTNDKHGDEARKIITRNSIRDIITVVYLSNLTRSQISVGSNLLLQNTIYHQNK